MKKLLILIAFSFALAACKPQDHKNGYATNDFTLTSTDGMSFALSKLKGSVVLLYFGYTNCPDACPLTLATITNVFKDLSEAEQKKVKTVFVSVDPDRDSPTRLKEYLSYYKTISPIGLTGSKEELQNAIGKFSGTFKKMDSDSKSGYLMMHPTSIYVLDPYGNLVFKFFHGEELRVLKDQIHSLL